MATFYADLAPWAFWALIGASAAGSFITVAFGIGGGVLLLTIMANLLPATALIPIHGIIQSGSNLSRTALFSKNIFWKPMLPFTIGTIAGIAFGGAVVVELPAYIIQIGVGSFVLWSLLANPPKWLKNSPAPIGAISSFLTMFFGATGVFVGNFVKSLGLDRSGHTATHACMMSLQHVLKVAMFAALGFKFAPWVPLILCMWSAGIVGPLSVVLSLATQAAEALRQVT